MGSFMKNNQRIIILERLAFGGRITFAKFTLHLDVG